MQIYKFRVEDSLGTKYVMECKATNYETARDRARDNCYRCGFCFMGRV